MYIYQTAKQPPIKLCLCQNVENNRVLSFCAIQPEPWNFNFFEGQLCLLKIRSECARVHLNNHNIILSGMHNQLVFYTLTSISLSYSRDWSLQSYNMCIAANVENTSLGIVKSNMICWLFVHQLKILRNVSNVHHWRMHIVFQSNAQCSHITTSG